MAVAVRVGLGIGQRLLHPHGAEAPSATRSQSPQPQLDYKGKKQKFSDFFADSELFLADDGVGCGSLLYNLERDVVVHIAEPAVLRGRCGALLLRRSLLLLTCRGLCWCLLTRCALWGVVVAPTQQLQCKRPAKSSVILG